MAPELLEGEIYNSKVDIFSLGCILYQAITGIFTFLFFFLIKICIFVDLL
jgi:serine/threonine protein kinase